MSSLREAAQQALEAIESDTVKFSAWTEKMLAAQTALRAALESDDTEMLLRQHRFEIGRLRAALAEPVELLTDEDTVIELAKQAKVKPLLYDGKWAVENLDVFAALVAAHEREKHQAQIDFLSRAYDILKKEVDELHQEQRDQIAAAIRSRT